MADWSRLQSRASNEVFSDTLTDPDDLVARLQPFDVICVMRERTPLPFQPPNVGGIVLPFLEALTLIDQFFAGFGVITEDGSVGNRPQ